jgi:hypothetical protein
MKNLENIHPGEILKEEFLLPLGISAYKLAKETFMPQTIKYSLMHVRTICKSSLLYAFIAVLISLSFLLKYNKPPIPTIYVICIACAVEVQIVPTAKP